MKKTRWNDLLAAGLLGLCLSQAYAMSPDKLYAQLAPSIWRVYALDKNLVPYSQGSAVVVDHDQLITNCHVLSKAQKIQIKRDDISLEARLLHVDVERDLCQLSAQPLNSPAVEIGDSDKLVVGQKIYTLGAPRGLELTLTDGLVSALRKTEGQLQVIQISAPISPGSSGGGLFDEHGRLIGITSAGVKDSQNLNMALPINWLNDLPQRSQVAYAQWAKTHAVSVQKEATPAQVPSLASARANLVASASEPIPAIKAVVPLEQAQRSVALPTPNIVVPDINDKEAFKVPEKILPPAKKVEPVSVPTPAPTSIASVPAVTASVATTSPVNGSIATPAITPVPTPATVSISTPPQASVAAPASPIKSIPKGPQPPAATNYAALDDPRPLEQFGILKGYETFLRTPLPRAFAFTANQKWWLAHDVKPNLPLNMQLPWQRAVKDCEQAYKRKCFLYAIDNEVVFQPE